jgi:hypothetical protein
VNYKVGIAVAARDCPCRVDACGEGARRVRFCSRWIAISFPQITSVFAGVAFPDAFAVICLTAAAVLTGHLVQAVSSLLEPLLDWTWGGRASERALRGELPSRYFPNDAAER